MDQDNNNLRKRKINGQDLSRYRRLPEQINGADHDDDLLTLTLSSYYHNTPAPPPPQQIIPPPPPTVHPHVPPHSLARAPRARRKPSQSHGPNKTATVPAPFPWATAHRATVHPLSYLLSKQITTISGEVHCKKCDQNYAIEYDLRSRFIEIGLYLAEEKPKLLDRAPNKWLNPALLSCRLCNQKNCVRPVISDKKKSINWLFLLLGEFLGCCTLDQLKYFCKHTKNHRTGAKDRVLYLTYLGLCKQLDPNGPFDR